MLGFDIVEKVHIYKQVQLTVS